MTTLIDIPDFDVAMPVLSAFIVKLNSRIGLREIDSADSAEQTIDAFFTDDLKNNLETSAPGWSQLLDHDGTRTLCHVVTALASLPDYEEYNEADTKQKTIITWALFYHDIAKRSANQRDTCHAFRSAVVAANNFCRGHADLADSFKNKVDAWSETTLNAAQSEPDNDTATNNANLIEIIQQLDLLFAPHSTANLIVKVILLHHSINTLQDWPQVNPLTDNEILLIFNAELLQLMRLMFLADSDGWELFHAERSVDYRSQIRSVFDRLERLITS